MTAEGITVDGAPMLAATLGRVGDNLDNLEKAARVTGLLVQSRARSRTPVRTGALSRSLTVQASGSDVAVSSSLVYAPVIHNGWPGHSIAANPFLIPVAEQVLPAAAEYYADDVQHLLDRVQGA